MKTLITYLYYTSTSCDMVIGLDLRQEFCLNLYYYNSHTFPINTMTYFGQVVGLRSIVKLKENGVSAINYEVEDYPLNEYLAEITYDHLINSDNDYNWAKVKPLYIQPPSIFGK